MTFSDQDIQAYLAGTLPTDRATALEDALMKEDTKDARLRRADPLAAVVDGAFVGLPNQPVVLQAPRPRVMWGAIAAALVACVLLGGSAVYYATTPEPSLARAWEVRVAGYQKLYSPVTLRGVYNGQSALGPQLAKASEAIDRDLMQNALRDIAGLELMRAQVLGLNGKDLIQIVFRTDDGMPIALCLMKNEDVTPRDVALAQTLDGLESMAWSDATHSFLLIGGEDDGAIADWSREVQSRLAG